MALNSIPQYSGDKRVPFSHGGSGIGRVIVPVKFTAKEAERTGVGVSGIEVTASNMLCLRVVRPVFSDDALIGYLELGRDLKDILERIHLVTGVHLGLSLDGSAVNAAGRKIGMAKGGRSRLRQRQRGVQKTDANPLLHPGRDAATVNSWSQFGEEPKTHALAR